MLVSQQDTYDYLLLMLCLIGSKVRLLNEQFIELFDTDLVGIPEVCPKWL